MKIRWRLRMAAAQREVWTGTELRRLLAERAGLELSAASVSALFTKEPSQIKLSTLIALCTALECTPDDLFEVDTTPVEQPAAPSAPGRLGAEDRHRAGPVDAADVDPTRFRNGLRLMGKRQRDCVDCGAPVGYIGREHCCRCTPPVTGAGGQGAMPGLRSRPGTAAGDGPVRAVLTPLPRMRRADPIPR